jgi:hypothetical protein
VDAVEVETDEDDETEEAVEETDDDEDREKENEEDTEVEELDEDKLCGGIVHKAPVYPPTQIHDWPLDATCPPFRQVRRSQVGI